MITTENKLVQCLKASAVNLELTSNLETNELFEKFEGYLMSLTYPVQYATVSMPIDLAVYIGEQEKLLEQTLNPYKKELIKSYIEYARSIEVNQDIMQRQRFIIITEQMKEDIAKERFEAMLNLEEKVTEIKAALDEMNLECEPVNDLEMARYLHTLFDYTGAQNRPIKDVSVPEIITGIDRTS